MSLTVIELENSRLRPDSHVMIECRSSKFKAHY